MIEVKTGEEIVRTCKVSVLEMFAYQGPPSKRWIETEGKVWEGWNKACDSLYVSLKGMVVLPKETWDKLEDILDDIVFLYKEYGMADETVLTLEANALRERILAVKDDFRLDELKALRKETVEE